VRRAAATFGLGAALLLAGCGASGSVAKKGDVSNGKAQFTASHKIKSGTYSCAACHTLADAGATGKLGPNLDTAFAFARPLDQKGYKDNPGDRFCQSTIQNVVLDQIKFPSKNNLEPQYVMPANIVTGKNAEDVAAYVASVAGVTPGKPAGKQATACS
jgi:mono/diheme cytochrome c family protein